MPAGAKRYIVRAVDWASRFQMAKVLPNKSAARSRTSW